MRIMSFTSSSGEQPFALGAQRTSPRHSDSLNLLGSVEGDFEVLSSILWIERSVVDRLGKIVMNERTEGHSVCPRRREVGDVDMLDATNVTGRFT